MKIALIGATGNAGSRILAELVSRGHEVTAIVRHPEKVPAN
ncbi:NAD(P)H-binding protein, partial [Paraburkholderia sp. SIMBA_050]